MVACFSLSTLDVLPARNINASAAARPSFNPQDALALLQKCAGFNQLKQIHAKLIRTALHEHRVIAGKLIRLCSSYGETKHATLVFQQMENPDTFVWNLLIRAHTVNSCSHQAILLFNLMIVRGVSADKFTFPFVIKACLDCSYVEKAREVYGAAVKNGFSGNIFLNNVLLDLYIKCGIIDDAMKMFDKMPARNVVTWTTMVAGLVHNGSEWMDSAQKLFDNMPVRRNVVSWTAMISGYAKSDKPEKAFVLFAKMQRAMVKPNEYTIVALLKACSRLKSLKLGCWVHEFTIKNGFEIGVFIGTALIDMYSKCGSLDYAKRVFEEMEVKSVATWNTMITSLGVHGCGQEAIELFKNMERLKVQPDALTLTGVLCACLQIDNIDMGRKYFNYMTECYGVKPNSEHLALLYTMYLKLLDSALPAMLRDETVCSMESKVTHSEKDALVSMRHNIQYMEEKKRKGNSGHGILVKTLGEGETV
ncbi:pentatricopeptide repeat-containing protein At3g26630, chloroplastic-like [Andrographis paniculata]|uniref:pentatricopeptide repeat-containing protein At3g26630, chloroplastic-like n=1 Tax=Andrographis paniculata TaxID=175694 RepID=UPI0021E72184|nr:pentatricopeptide repeat-containing protein At3g26630, chloroplastic-like [Andrographis paniculata]